MVSPIQRKHSKESKNNRKQHLNLLMIKFGNNNLLFLCAAVQHERGPRNSTIRRQVAMYLKETRDYGAFVAQAPFRPPYLPSCYGIDPMANGVDIGSVTPPSPVSPGILCQPTPKVRQNAPTKSNYLSTRRLIKISDAKLCEFINTNVLFAVSPRDNAGIL